MKHWLLSVLLVVCGTVSAQITLVKDGKSSARIIVQDKMPNSKTSAQFLQRFLTEISEHMEGSPPECGYSFSSVAGGGS